MSCDLARAFGKATHEVLRDARIRIARLVPQIPRVACQPRGTLHAGAAIRVDSFAAVTLLARGERARFAFLFAAAFLVAQHLGPPPIVQAVHALLSPASHSSRELLQLGRTSGAS